MHYGFFEQLIGLLLISVFLYFGYRRFMDNPELFSLNNTHKSLTTMGVIALVLMAFVFFLLQIVGSGSSYSNRPILNGQDSNESYDERSQGDGRSI